MIPFLCSDPIKCDDYNLYILYTITPSGFWRGSWWLSISNPQSPQLHEAKGGIVIFDNEGFFSGSSYDEYGKAESWLMWVVFIFSTTTNIWTQYVTTTHKICRSVRF
jgi:hypothetical protein